MGRTGVVLLALPAFVLGLIAGLAAMSAESRSRTEEPAIGDTAGPPSQRAARHTDLPQRYRIPVTRSQPFVGPVDAPVTIVEWGDPTSAATLRMQERLERLRARYSNKLRIVWRNYAPVQRPNAFAASELAMQAYHEAGGERFWKARRLLAASPPRSRADLDRVAAALDLDQAGVRKVLDDHVHAAHIVADRRFGEIFAVSQAPTLFVNGRRVPSGANPTELEGLVDGIVEQELRRAEQLIKGGVASASVYAELTRGSGIRAIP